ncbi:MAG: DUF885 domain-containing protein [Candidatus Eisenbacteria bacterium]|uniref:DUF885 domain-containing protein n=1 Tax=Eiseniibacteriota bacterium TaxID=2212470 RepID=A0A933SC82_UNCEI|nr:DUF885 domain-containing protein [Candidatus Eisenbacteria bacterium]
MTPRSLFLAAALLAAVASLPSEAASPRAKRAASPTTAYSPGATLASLRFPGTPAFVAVAKDVIAQRFAIDPSGAANNGLFDDGARIPSFAPDTVAARIARLDRDLEALRAMPWRSWPVDRQVDWRWIVANAEEARLQLADERLFLHRPVAWLEPLANTFIALITYAPERADIRLKLARGIPAMVVEMRTVVQQPTARDVTTAKGVADGILAVLRSDPPSPVRDAAIGALTSYVNEAAALTGLRDYEVIGREHYEKRLRSALLLPWNGDQLLARANAELARTDSAMGAIKARISPNAEIPPAPVPTEAQRALASTLDQQRLLAIYDDITRTQREFLDTHDLVTVPASVGPIHARPTPAGMIPLTGDGGSMNPPPPVGRSNVGWWNVEHMDTSWTLERKAGRIAVAQGFRETGMGPYAAHEGVPGHHLQLSICRLNPNPIRWILQDNCLVEGWALYAEEVFWAAGGHGDSPLAQYRMLGSYRGRIRRVVYDVNIERGEWTLQQAADWKRGTEPGKSRVDEDVMRSIHWPAQLIAYFTGKSQLMDLRRDYQRKMGAAYSERAFHDAVLAEGSIPVALIRAKLLGEPVPAP